MVIIVIKPMDRAPLVVPTIFNAGLVEDYIVEEYREMLTLSLIILLLVVLMVVYYLLFIYLDRRAHQEYQDLQEEEYYRRVGNVEDHCPSGCVGGICRNRFCPQPFPRPGNPNPVCCAFDYQCKYCPDVGDGFTREYEAIKNQYHDSGETERLNQRIFNENVYIARINRTVAEDNSTANESGT